MRHTQICSRVIIAIGAGALLGACSRTSPVSTDTVAAGLTAVVSAAGTAVGDTARTSDASFGLALPATKTEPSPAHARRTGRAGQATTHASAASSAPPTQSAAPLPQVGAHEAVALLPIDTPPAVPEHGREPSSPLVPVNEPAPREAADDGHVYSAGDPDVEPPRLDRSQVTMPLFHGGARAINVMELVVGTSGRVEQVRLLSDPKRLTDMLLLSGAKTWKFEPALRAGKPVRYRTEFRWEATP